MSFDLKPIQEKRRSLADAMHGMLEASEKENRGFDNDELAKWNGMREDIEALDDRLTRMTEDNSRQLVLEQPANLPEGGDDDDDDDEDEIVDDFGVRYRRRKKGSGKGDGDGDEQYRRAFLSWLRSDEPGMSGLSAEDRDHLKRHAVHEERAGATSPSASGGYLVPVSMAGIIQETMKAYGGIRQYATVMSTGAGEDIQFPTNDDTGNKGALVGENQQVAEMDFAFGQATLGAYKYSSNVVRVSIELLQDSNFGLDQFIARKFGQRLGRITSEHYATGTGTNQPQGLMTAAAVGHTTTSTTEVAYKDYLHLKHAVDPAYRQSGSCYWVMNDALLLKAKEMLDANNRPMWKPSMADGSPSLIDGDPYIIDQGVMAPAAGKVALGYGDISEFHIRDVQGFSMHRLVEKYIDYGQIGYLSFLRTDSELLDAAAFKTLKMKS